MWMRGYRALKVVILLRTLGQIEQPGPEPSGFERGLEELEGPILLLLGQCARRW